MTPERTAEAVPEKAGPLNPPADRPVRVKEFIPSHMRWEGVDTGDSLIFCLLPPLVRSNWRPSRRNSAPLFCSSRAGCLSWTRES